MQVRNSLIQSLPWKREVPGNHCLLYPMHKYTSSYFHWHSFSPPNIASASLYFQTINLSNNFMESTYLPFKRIIAHNFVKFPLF
jgi:hypothetical protein